MSRTGAAGLQRAAEGTTTFPDYAFLVSDTVLVRLGGAASSPLSAQVLQAPSLQSWGLEDVRSPAEIPRPLDKRQSSRFLAEAYTCMLATCRHHTLHLQPHSICPFVRPGMLLAVALPCMAWRTYGAQCGCSPSSLHLLSCQCAVWCYGENASTHGFGQISRHQLSHLWQSNFLLW